MALRETPLIDAEGIVGKLYPRKTATARSVTTVMLRSDGRAAYPVVAGVPILMAPEVLAAQPIEFDLEDVRWAEAYKEMAFYNHSAEEAESSVFRVVADIEAAVRLGSWPESWVDAPYDAASQLQVLEYLGHPKGKVVLQLGGHGGHAVRMLAAGAAEAWLVTPMLSEALFGLKLAKLTGTGDRFHAVVGIAEQVPLSDGTFDSVYTGGCLHHMATRYAGPEVRRLLKPRGRFGAVEPWQTTLHKYGTKLIGKREANAYCRPLDSERLGPMRTAFPELKVQHHGPLLRYAALAVQKLTKRAITPRIGLRMTAIDDRLPLPRRMGGSIAVLAER